MFAAPCTVASAMRAAWSAGMPIASPARARASTKRNRKAGPQPDSAVTRLNSISSAIHSARPSGAISASICERAAGDVRSSVNSATTPCPRPTGRFGMARTMSVAAAKRDRSSFSVVPARIDMIGVSAVQSGASALATSAI